MIVDVPSLVVSIQIIQFTRNGASSWNSWWNVCWYWSLWSTTGQKLWSRSNNQEYRSLCQQSQWVESSMHSNLISYIYIYIYTFVFFLFARIDFSYQNCIEGKDWCEMWWEVHFKQNISMIVCWWRQIIDKYSQNISMIVCWWRQIIDKYSQTCPVTCIKRSPFSSPVVDNFIWIEPLLRGHLS